MQDLRLIYSKQSQQIIDFLKETKCQRKDPFQYVQADKIFHCSKTGKIIAKNKNELMEIMGIAMFLNGYEHDLDFIDVSNVEDFSHLFSDVYRFKLNSRTEEIRINFRLFNGSIKTWDVRKGKNFTSMFFMSNFNKHELNFNFEKAECAKRMFYGSKFNKAFQALNINRLKNIEYMFMSSNIEQPIYMDLSNNSDCRFLGAFNSEQITAQQLNYVKFPEKPIRCVRKFISFAVLQAKNKPLNLIKFLENFSPKKVKQFLDLENCKKELNLYLIDGHINNINNINKLIAFNESHHLKKEIKDYIKSTVKNNLEPIFKQINHEFENLKKNSNDDYYDYHEIFGGRKDDIQAIIKYCFKHFIIGDDLLERYKEIIVHFNWNEDEKLQNKSEKQFEIAI